MALITAITNIPLWDALYEMYTKQGKEPTDSIILLLETYCGLSPNKAREIAPEVKRQYHEDVKGIGRHIVMVVNENLMINEDVSLQRSRQNSQGLTEYSYGKYKVSLPENEEEARIVWSKLKKMVDSVIGEEKPQ